MSGSQKTKKGTKKVSRVQKIDKHKFRDKGKELLDSMTPQEKSRLTQLKRLIEEDESRYLENSPSIRKAAELTQEDVAQKLGMAQAGISRLENQGDMLLSTLGKYLEAVGKNPRLIVEINGKDYELDLGALAESLV